MALILRPQEKTVLFIDGANVYGVARGLSLNVDFKKMISLFKERTQLVRAYYFTGIKTESNNDRDDFVAIKRLLDFLDYNGYHLVTKKAKNYTDSTGMLRTKGNMDVEIAIYMLDCAPFMDHAVLFSGDGDFTALLNAVQNRGVRTTVVSSVRTSPPSIADELRRQADDFVDLAEWDEIQRKD